MSNPTITEKIPAAAKLFAVIFGSFLGLALLKFCTPSVLDQFVELPTKEFTGSWDDFIQWAVLMWPLRIAYPLLAGVVVAGLFAIRWRDFAPRWLMAMPLLWLFWQFIAETHSADPRLSQGVLVHFGICLICFYLGALCLNHDGLKTFVLWPLAVAFAIAVGIGLNQHFGGLEESRKYFWSYIYPTLPKIPLEYIKKMQTNRIFSTVFYPNAFAGALLLLMPPILAWIWQAKRQFTISARALLCGLFTIGGSACLYWTGSKGGWLLALLMGFVALLHQKFPIKLKWALIVALLVSGSAGFYWKNRAYMERGATSVVARFDYWRAAWHTAVSKPIFGSGPGTFAIAYEAVRKPGSEMARLTHNDYLQQASDSGFPGLITYATFIGGMLWVGYRRLDWNKSPVTCAAWLGLVTWAAQSAFEFTLYVPALAWTAFAIMGWLLGSTRETIRQAPATAPTLSPR